MIRLAFVLLFFATATTVDAQPSLTIKEESLNFDSLTNSQRSIKKVGQLSNEDAEKRGFDLKLHTALADGKTGRQCTDELISAQWNQDVWHFFNSEAHFDNCAFASSLNYIRELRGSTGKAIENKDIKSALKGLGQILHAIQDFYAHSNYVELMHTEYNDFSRVPIISIWNNDGESTIKQLLPKGLISGIWKASLPSSKFCGDKGLTHSQLAKDNISTTSGEKILDKWHKTGFEAAYSLADNASFEFLQWAYKEWPLLEETCGPIIGYGLLFERR